MDYKTALKIATEAHKGQKRWNGDDYITHPIRVANQFTNEKLKVIAILHDVIEDTKITADDLFNKYELDSESVRDLIYLTKTKNMLYSDYIYNVKRRMISRTIKVADLNDNLQDLPKGQRRDKYELALLYLCD